MFLLARDTIQYLDGLHEFFREYLFAETLGSQGDYLSLEDHDDDIDHHSLSCKAAICNQDFCLMATHLFDGHPF